MAAFTKLMNGEIEFRLSAEDRRLLKELVRQERLKPGRRNRQVNQATVLIPLIRGWCRRPRVMPAVRSAHKPARVDTRALYDHEKAICRDFVGLLKKRREKSASTIMAALLHEHLESSRKELEEDARMFETLTRRKRLRAASLAAAVQEFLNAAPQRGISRAATNLDQDAEALVNLGRWVAQQFVAVTKAKAQRHPGNRAANQNREFAKEMTEILVFGVSRPSELIATPKFGPS